MSNERVIQFNQVPQFFLRVKLILNATFCSKRNTSRKLFVGKQRN